MTDNHNTQRKIIRGYKALTDKIGGSRVKAWRDVRAGLLPPPIVLGPNSVGWFEDEIDQWLADRPRVNYAPQPAESDTESAHDDKRAAVDCDAAPELAAVDCDAAPEPATA